MNLWRDVLIRAVVIGVAALVLAGIDGTVRGFDPPPKVDTSAKPPMPPRPRVDVTADVPLPAPESSEGGLTTEELKYLLDMGTVLLADARTREEYEAGHIPTAFYVPADVFGGGQIPESVGMLIDIVTSDPDMSIVVYCGGGDCHASETVASQLLRLGVENVYVYVPGYPAWVEAGYEIETGAGMFE